MLDILIVHDNFDHKFELQIRIWNLKMENKNRKIENEIWKDKSLTYLCLCLNSSAQYYFLRRAILNQRSRLELPWIGLWCDQSRRIRDQGYQRRLRSDPIGTVGSPPNGSDF